MMSPSLASILSVSALLSPLRPPIARLRVAAPPCCTATEAQDFIVKRGADGGLGVLVDQDNTIVTNTAQPELQVGDVIVGVDGESLSGRPISECLTPGSPQYTFSVMRPSSAEAGESLERVLLQLVREASGDSPKLLCFADDEDAAARAETIVEGLESAAASGGLLPSSEALGSSLRSGFWRLLLVSEASIARGGLTSYGLAPYCSVLASFQAFIDLKGEQTAQVVEVVANANLGSATVAALKGSWKGGDGAAVDERYDRTEYSGAPEIGAPKIDICSSCTYLSKRLRVIRMPASGDKPGAWRVYGLMAADAAQMEIGRLLELPVAPAARSNEPPDWARRGGGGGGPSAEPGAMGPM